MFNQTLGADYESLRHFMQAKSSVLIHAHLFPEQNITPGLMASLYTILWRHWRTQRPVTNPCQMVFCTDFLPSCVTIDSFSPL